MRIKITQIKLDSYENLIAWEEKRAHDDHSNGDHLNGDLLERSGSKPESCRNEDICEVCGVSLMSEAKFVKGGGYKTLSMIWSKLLLFPNGMSPFKTLAPLITNCN